MCSISSILSPIYRTCIFLHSNTLSVPYLPLFASIYSYCGQFSPIWVGNLYFLPIFVSKFCIYPKMSAILYFTQKSTFSALLQYESAFGRANFSLFQSNLWDLRTFLPLWSMGKFLVGYTALRLGLCLNTAKLQKNC